MNTSMQYDQVIQYALDEITRDSVDSFTQENAITLAQAVVEYKISNTLVNLSWCSIGFHCYRSTDSKKPNGEYRYTPDDYRQLEADITFFGDTRDHDTKIEINVYDGNSFREMLAAFYALKTLFLDIDNSQKAAAFNSLRLFFKNQEEKKL
jgi:hypothetical protein